jgi:tyrosine-protein kinase Etk/Wzc
MIEALRSLRLCLGHLQQPNVALSLAVSSACPSDGKSLVISNLALAFAEAGYRTLLVDADVRRGELHTIFGQQRVPGLLEFLASSSLAMEDVLRPTSQPRLSFVATGKRTAEHVRLLGSKRMFQLVQSAQREFDVVLLDTPPLTAGADAYTLGVIAGHMLFVLRAGHTNRRLAEAKLQMADRLPIRLVGAVLNDLPSDGVYEYYSYIPYLDSDLSPTADSAHLVAGRLRAAMGVGT